MQIKIRKLQEQEQEPNDVVIKDSLEYLKDQKQETTLNSMEEWEESLITNYDNVKKVYEVGHKTIVEPSRVIAKESKERIKELKTELPQTKDFIVDLIKRNKKIALIILAVLVILPFLFLFVNGTGYKPLDTTVFFIFVSLEVMVVGVLCALALIGRELYLQSKNNQPLVSKATLWRIMPYVVFALIWAFVVFPLMILAFNQFGLVHQYTLIRS